MTVNRIAPFSDIEHQVNHTIITCSVCDLPYRVDYYGLMSHSQRAEFRFAMVNEHLGTDALRWAMEALSFEGLLLATTPTP